MIVKGFKKCLMSDEMDGREDKKEAGNVGSKHGTVSSERETEDGN
jgi:hypothetical protein